MKSNIRLLIIELLGSICFILLLNPVCVAQSNVSIKDVSVELIKIRPPVGETIIREYRIRVLLCNTGDTISSAISVKFQEPEGSGNLTMQPLSYSLQPNEEKTFVFENWPTILSGDVPLNISFGPASHYVNQDSTNSGFYVYTLTIANGKTTTSTPGFEIIILLMALFALMFKKQIKKK
ncbi:hypothetical protein AYK25_03785 [Thermoplasmatales archaeon SM1-50]|nr:MAG: hypothetical protein AYK25_03785 [Thermoplasmatales archaeon SM1-50]